MLKKVSISDLLAFDGCRRSWYLGYHRRYDLFVPQIELSLGSAVHTALEAWYSGTEGEGTMSAYDRAWERIHYEYKSKFHDSYVTIQSDLEAAQNLGEQMLHHYMVYDTEETYWAFPQHAVVEQPELRIEMPIIPHPELTGDVEGPIGNLVGKLDLVLEAERGGSNQLWVIDHKTFKTPPDSQSLDVDMQMTGYAYLAWRKFGRIPDLIVYNVLVKTAPAPPRLIRGGKALSVDKTQPTTYALFKEAIKENGFNEDDYVAYLEYLQGVGFGNYFVRETSTRTQSELEAFERELWLRYYTMSLVADQPDPFAFPSGSVYSCGRCIFKQPCKVWNEGGDVVSFMRGSYTTY